MLDFFVRFKVSRKVTIIVTKPILKIFLVLILTFALINAASLFIYLIGEEDKEECSNPLSCLEVYFLNYMGLQKNVSAPINISALNIFGTLPRFVLKLINFSLIIGVLLG